MDVSDLTCREQDRRRDVRAGALYGLDYVEVSDDQRQLEVFFLGRAPQQLDKANLRICGGRRVTDIRVTDLRIFRQRDPTLDDRLEIDLDRYGDYSTYTLSLVETDRNGNPTDRPLAGFDPRYSAVDFSFKAGCPTDLDCKAEPACPPPQRAQPEINYLAKDYASFRQLILDRLALIMPDWREQHIPDIGVMLVELLAYVGDHLSYYQDAVATEAYLDTARQRISVRRHARLVDYAMHEGCNARAWLVVNTEADTPDDHPIDPAKIWFCTALSDLPDTRIRRDTDVQKLPPGSYEAFSPLLPDPIRLSEAHNEIHFYTWGDCACCLPKGATRATLTDAWPNIPKADGGDPKKPPADAPKLASRAAAADPGKPDSHEPPGAVRALKLKVGDVLIFEEVIGPKTGNRADADPLHRQAVRLTKVTQGIDPLYHPYGSDYGQPIVEIEWCSEDALTFPLCISATMPPPECDCRAGISVARGNVVLVDNSLPHDVPIGTVGKLTSTELCPTDCSPGEVTVTPERFRPALPDRPLTFSQPLAPRCCAVAMIAQDPRRALPRITLTGTLPVPKGANAESWTPQTMEWTPQPDLLESGPGDASFVVEIDDFGLAHLRFGDGRCGRRPDAGTAFEARYRIGNGPSGNVGAETINTIVLREAFDLGALTVRNPLPAVGGTAPEPVAEVKMFAPDAFRATRERAITADDYAAFAADNARRLAERVLPRRAGASHDIPFRRLQSAKGALRWTGSWYEAQVAIDPLGVERADHELYGEIERYLARYRRVGHDLDVALARFAPIDLALTVCVLPHALRGHVEAALIDAFSSRVLSDGRLGFFHPDNQSFGAGVFVSRITAAAQAVNGVMEVTVTRLARYRIGTRAADGSVSDVPASGVLALAPFEIARLDSDPNYPENGRLTLIMRGGR